MPSSVIARIRSALKRLRKTTIVGVFALVVLAGSVFWPRTTYIHLSLSGRTYRLEVAESQEAQLKGLSGRASLPKDQGMLFTFREGGKPCMWMKDMRFPLDMLWLDAQQRVVHMARNVSPLTYPRVFCPRAPATYVVELHAGETAAAHVYVGQRLSF